MQVTLFSFPKAPPLLLWPIYLSADLGATSPPSPHPICWLPGLPSGQLFMVPNTEAPWNGSGIHYGHLLLTHTYLLYLLHVLHLFQQLLTSHFTGKEEAASLLIKSLFISLQIHFF